MAVSKPDIRPFEAEDLPALQHIREAAFAPVFRSFREIVGEDIAGLAFAKADEEQARLLDDICVPNSAHRVLIAAVGGEVIGFVTYTLDAATQIGEIGLNAVHPDHAGKGVGTFMYAHVLARMKAEGAVLATVGTGGDPSHAPARRAYAKAGFGPGLPSVYLYRKL